MGRYEMRAYVAFLVVGLVLIGSFAYTWFSPSNISVSFRGALSFLNVFLFVVTSYVVWHEIISSLHIALLLPKMKKWKHSRPQKDLKVAFITTFVPGKEPHSMLRQSLTSITAVDYKHDTWLLDEGNDSEAKRICEELGVRHFSRKNRKEYNTDGGTFTARTKGGNHNAWYDAHGHKYDIVAQADLDFIVKRNFLTETLGQFKDPKVAFVGTPQYYGNYDDGLVARGAAEQSFSFYGPVERGLAGVGMPMMVGANHIIRVEALKGIGWYAAHLTEDLLTGMTLYANGWKGAYCPKILAVGEGPTTWESFFVQQMRWAHGCFDILFRHSYRLLKTMTIPQRIRFTIMLQHYFSGMNLVLGSMLLCLYFVFGLSGASYPSELSLLIYLPLLMWLFIMPLWHHRFNINPKKEKGLMIAGKIANLAVQPVFFLALIGALRNKKLHFIVTPKGQEPSSRIPFKLFRIHLVLGIAAIGGLIYGLSTGKSSFVLIFWAVANIFVAAIFAYICLMSRLKHLSEETRVTFNLSKFLN
jgi:cellulose synthase (UDP-forming)